MAMAFQLWRLVEVKDERRSTWELVGTFTSPRKARARIFELAGNHVVFPEEETIWYEDNGGVHTFKIEATPVA
jgi:hypothetical protein